MMRRKVCLTMIVKDESKVIERALRSAAPFIDTYSICDTGSSDKTKDIIKKNNVRVRERWRDS
jgi:glycosyltransferase involved in cell wall biosynthesis